jgi:hypothetical protein
MAGYNGGREEKKKKKKKEKNEGMGWSTALLLFLSRAPSVGRGMETGVIPESCSLLEQCVFRVNPDEAPHAMIRVGGVK